MSFAPERSDPDTNMETSRAANNSTHHYSDEVGSYQKPPTPPSPYILRVPSRLSSHAYICSR